jgi:UDP-glucose 4-epimerase
VVVLDDLSTGRRANIASVAGRCRFVRGDVRDRLLVDDCARGADYIFHHAAQAAVPLSIDDPILSAQVNDLGTLNVFLAGRDAGVRRIVSASSSAVYGDNPVVPHVETTPPTPDTPYAAHKMLGEQYGAMFLNYFGLEVVSLRYFNVYGPRQDPSSPYSGVISIFMDRLAQGLAPTVFGDGEQTRDFIHVSDVVRANFLAVQARDVAGLALNVGCGREVSLNQMLDLLGDITGVRIEAAYEPARPGDPRRSRADIDLARQKLGFTAKTTFAHGLADTWDWRQRSSGT